MKTLNERQILNSLIEYIIITLNEFENSPNISDFGEGTVLAYVDCLEILSKWKGFKKFGISDIETHFGIK